MTAALGILDAGSSLSTERPVGPPIVAMLTPSCSSRSAQNLPLAIDVVSLSRVPIQSCFSGKNRPVKESHTPIRAAAFLELVSPPAGAML